MRDSNNHVSSCKTQNFNQAHFQTCRANNLIFSMIGLLQTKTSLTKPTTSWSVEVIIPQTWNPVWKKPVSPRQPFATTRRSINKMQQRQLQHGLKRVFINYFTQACVIVWESYNLAVLQEWPELISSKQNWSSRRPVTCSVPFIEITLKNWQKTFSSGE